MDQVSVLPLLMGPGLAIGIACVGILMTLVMMGVSFFVVGRVLKAMKGVGASDIPNGVSAPAMVVSLADTGVSINDNPQIQLQLQVHAPEGATFTASVSTFVSRVQTSAFQQGAIVHVRYNRDNPQQIAIVGPLGMVEPYAPPGADAVPALVPLLQRVIESQERTQALQQAPEAPATVRSARPLGLYCNGRNPLMAITVEVKAPGQAPYTAEATGVISQLSVDRYQPGSSIFVRTDPANPKNITLSRSS